MRSIAAILLLFGTTAWAAATVGTTTKPATPATPAADQTVATVGGVPVMRAELDDHTRQALEAYRARAGSEVPPELEPVVRRQMLERLIQRQLLAVEAKRRGIAVSDAEAEEVLRQDPFFNPDGRFNEARYQTAKTTQPAQFKAALEQARQRVAMRKLTEAVLTRERPADAELRSRAMHGLERATFEYLALRRGEFPGTYPEPRESEILAYYREYASELRRPDRAELTLLPIQQELTDSIARDSERLASWERGLKSRADSVLKVVRAGTPLEQVARPFGGLRSRVGVSPGNFPSLWRGDEALSRSVFEQRPGSMLPVAVPSNPGWLVVRVDEVERAHPARLVEAAKEIRAQLRLDRRQHREERELRALYEAKRDSLKGPAIRLRYALIDTTALDPGEPSAAELDRFYRGHLADYSTFSSSAGAVVTQSFAEVREDVRARWRQEKRLETARVMAERIQESWSRGKRDPKLERGLVVREVGPVPAGSPVDIGGAGAAIADALRRRGSAPGVEVTRYPGGTVVYHLIERIPDYVPTFEQAGTDLAEWRAEEQARRDERGARELFDRNPRDFAIGKRLHWTSILVEPPDFMTMTMTHREVEEYQRRHLERYSAPEVVHASHILVTLADASPEADARARARADSLRVRLRKGEDFARLARQYSDDEATRDQGGDLGEFGRGAMLQGFERVAFGMQPGQVSEVFKTEAGYHIIRCHEHLTPLVQPLALMYSNVSADLASDRADTVAARRADSLRRAVRTPAQARAAAKKLVLTVMPYERAVGEPTGGDPKLEAFVRTLEQTSPGQLCAGVYYAKGTGYMISWVDSITPPAAPTWEEGRSRAIERYRRGSSQRALEAKRAELDSMMTSGWSFDSLATLFGGLEEAVDAHLSTSLPYLGARDLDSLVFGTRRPARLKIGEVSDWVPFPAGFARLRVLDRFEPDPRQFAARLEDQRRLADARALEAYFETLKQRHPVRILDRELRDVVLPSVPQEASR